MINNVLISRLDELIGDFDTPFFNYLLYSYNLELNESEEIIEDLKRDINDNKISADNLIGVVDDYFQHKVIDLEKRDKLNYLNQLMDRNNEFFTKYLEKYRVSNDDITRIHDKIKNEILENNITDFEIKRSLEYYFSNVVKKEKLLNELKFLSGKNYDALFVKNLQKKYPNLTSNDFYKIFRETYNEILDDKEFKTDLKKEVEDKAMRKSEVKKAEAIKKLESFTDGSGDSFEKLLEIKNLTVSDGKKIEDEIKDKIFKGHLTADKITNVYLTIYCNNFRV